MTDAWPSRERDFGREAGGPSKIKNIFAKDRSKKGALMKEGREEISAFLTATNSSKLVSRVLSISEVDTCAWNGEEVKTMQKRARGPGNK